MTDTPFNFEILDIKFAQDSIMKITPGNYMFPESYRKIIPQVYNMELRSDDVWLIGPPKSGTTWASEMIWIVNNGDVESAEKNQLLCRIIYPDMDAFGSVIKETTAEKGIKNETARDLLNINMIEKMNNCESKRFIRTHIPLSLLPPKLLDTCKVIFIARDNRDCCVSWYHMMKGSLYEECKDFYDMFKLFISEKIAWGPYPPVIKEAWDLRNHKNLMFIFYEEMIQDLPSVIQKTATFLGQEKLSDHQLRQLVNHLNIKNMKKNKNVNMEEFGEEGILGVESKFIRKGIIGDWKNHFTPSMEKEFQEWWDSYMKDSDFKFPEISC